MATETFRMYGGEPPMMLQGDDYAFCAVTYTSDTYDSRNDTVRGACLASYNPDGGGWWLAVTGSAECTYECIRQSSCTDTPHSFFALETTVTASRDRYPYCASGGNFQYNSISVPSNTWSALTENQWRFSSAARGSAGVYNCIPSGNVCNENDIVPEVIDVQPSRTSTWSALFVPVEDFPFCAPNAASFADGQHCSTLRSGNEWALMNRSQEGHLCQFNCINR